MEILLYGDSKNCASNKMGRPTRVFAFCNCILRTPGGFFHSVCNERWVYGLARKLQNLPQPEKLIRHRLMHATKAHHSLKLNIKMNLRAAFKFLSPLYQLRNRIRCNEAWVIVLASRFHTRELVEQLASQGHKIFLFDSSPDQANWRFACRSCAVDIYDRAYIPLILQTARNLGCNTVLMPQDDNLIPIYAEVNRLLDNDTRFSEDAVQASLSKTFMRTKLTEAGMEVPAWKIIKGADDIAAVPFPAVVKPPYGQGSKGITYVKSEAEAGIAVNQHFQ